ncbi:acetolactate synthase large subunit, partial [Pseudomonadota bacterium]|nr:acetolactate synthase large subunit [Pseudomonadota bacterium]
KVPVDLIDSAVIALKEAKNPMILVGGAALEEKNLMQIAKIADKVNCPIKTDWFNARLDKGAGRINSVRIPYVVEKAVEVLKEFDTIIVIGARRPVAFFAYPNKPGVLTQDNTNFIELASLSDDITGMLEELSDKIGVANNVPNTISELKIPEIPSGPINPSSLGMVLGALIPENAIVVDESVTTGREFFAQTSGSLPHTWLNNCGGSIGFGMPVAIGAAVACPDQKVISLEGDGSAMYTVQSLWTMARENLDITVLIFANQSYKILKGELTNVGVTNPGKSALEMLSLKDPSLDWVSVSKGMGVDAVRVDTIEDLVKCFKHGLKEKGPFLIEVML